MKRFHLYVLFLGCYFWFTAKWCTGASCHPNPCMNGGLCHTLPNTTTEFCLCPHNFTGSRFCHPSNTATTASKFSTTDRLSVQEVTTQSFQHTIAESRNNNGTTSTRRQPTTNTRVHVTSSSGNTSDQASTKTSRRVDKPLTTSENPLGQHSSTQSVKDVASITRTLAGTTRRFPLDPSWTTKAYVVEAKGITSFPTKDTKKQGRNYSLWFTWIVILLFVTSVLLLILAIALFISYGREGAYNADDEHDSQDYPPEEDDLSGRKQVFNLKFT